MADPAPPMTRSPTTAANRSDDPVGLFLEDNGARLARVLTDKASVFSEKDVQRTLSHIGDWDVDRSRLDPAVDAAFAAQVKTRLLSDPEHITRFEDNATGRALYTTPEILAMERTLLETAREWHQSGVAVPESTISEAQAEFEKWHEERGFDIDPNMMPALRDMLGENRISLLDAPPGAGKSTAAKGLAIAHGKNGTSIMVVGPSDVVTADLVAETGAERSQTLPELLHKVKTGEPAIDPSMAVIVDEAGMIGTRDMHTLFNAIHDSGARLHLIGDGKQIAPSNAGMPFRVFCEQLPHISLTQTFRQKKEEDRQITLNLWHGALEDAINTLEDRGSIHRRQGMSNVLKTVSTQYADWYEQNQDSGKVGLALALGHENAREINFRTRDILKDRGLLAQGRTVQTPDGPLEMATGDRVILGADIVDASDDPRNPKRATAGATGRVVAVDRDGLQVRIDGKQGPVIRMPSDAEVPVAHAYALDLSRIQGVSVDQAFTAVTREFEYGEALVALSRHKTHAITVVDEDIYPTRASLKRQLEAIRPQETAMDLLLDPGRFRRMDINAANPGPGGGPR